MRKPSADLYSTRLRAAMHARNCSEKTLAKACKCAVETIRLVCKEGSDKPLGTLFHLRAATFLNQDPVRLACGNAMPINPDLEGPVTFYTVDTYEREDTEGKELFHKHLERAVAALPDPPPRRLRKKD